MQIKETAVPTLTESVSQPMLTFSSSHKSMTNTLKHLIFAAVVLDKEALQP